MKIAELLARDKNSSTAIHEAIARTEAAGAEARGRMLELDSKRRDALLADNERDLDRIEAALKEAERDADRAGLAVIELRDRLKEDLDRERGPPSMLPTSAGQRPSRRPWASSGLSRRRRC